jgi:hypothetical protein
MKEEVYEMELKLMPPQYLVSCIWAQTLLITIGKENEKNLYIVMVRYFTNINNTNNHLSTQFIEHKKDITSYEIVNISLGFRKAFYRCGGVEPVNEILT